METKTCRRCGQSKALEKFSNLVASPDGKQKWCKLCHRLSKYKLTEEQFDAMNTGECHLCGREARLVIDHCHRTGRVRGLLCNPCNGAVAVVEDRGHMDAIAAYINQPPMFSESGQATPPG